MIRWTVALVFGSMIVCAQWVGYMTQPWARWYVASPQAALVPLASVPMEPVVNVPGRVGDVERYELARAAGWSPADAVTATAISFAEDGSGDPSVLSPRNFDGSQDLGLLQINSVHWASCGGREALTLPINNFRCGHAIYLRQGWCAWSTYLASCGRGHTSSYQQFISRATAAAIRCDCP